MEDKGTEDNGTVLVGCITLFIVIIIMTLSLMFWGWVLQYLLLLLFGKEITLLTSSLIILFINYGIAVTRR